MKLIDKSAIVAEIEKRLDELYDLLPDARNVEYGTITISEACNTGKYTALESFKDYIDTLEVKDPYEQCIQNDSIKAGIQAHAETYSFNIGSELFNQLTKEQQALWRKEIEQAVISGGEVGVELAKDIRYKENRKVKKVGISVPNIDDTLKEEGFDPDSKEAKIIKESYFMAIEKLAQKGE